MYNNAALENAVSATLTGPFIKDLAVEVANNGSDYSAIRWLWTSLSGSASPIYTYDRYISVIERLNRTWPVMRMACEMFDIRPPARFVADRIAAAVDEEMDGCWYAPATVALVLADRAHDIAALFSVGLKPNGSKDPYALRRAAKHFIIASIMIPPDIKI